MRLLGQNITVSGAKASAIMGITHTPLDQAIDETAQWWRSRMAPAAGNRSVQDMPTVPGSQVFPAAAFELSEPLLTGQRGATMIGDARNIVYGATR